MDDTEGVSLTEIRVSVLWPDRGSGTVRGYAGSGLGLVRMSFEDDRPEWGCAVSPMIGMRIQGSRLRLSLETGVEIVFTEGTVFGAVPFRVTFPF